MTHKCVATVFGTPDESQKLLIEYEYIQTGGFFSPAKIEVNYCAVINLLQIKPSDLNEDLAVGIAEDLGVPPYAVRIECDVEIPNAVTQEPEPEMMFV